MLFELFVVGTFWFWLLIVAELVVLFACAAAETFRYRGALATASLVVTLLALQLFGNVPVWQFIVNNPLTVLAGVGIFLIGGVIWVFPKWYLFVKEHYRKYNELKQDFLDSKDRRCVAAHLRPCVQGR